MISILIPVYNYSITGLVGELTDQGNEFKQPFEILILDDCSSDKEITITNQKFCEERSVTYIISDKNLGNADARNYLASQANYDWFLFIDADMMPVGKDFLSNYFEAIHTNKKVVCSNIVYEDEKPAEGILRWKYGKKYEEASIEERRKNPYLTFRLACFMIHKSLYEQNPFSKQKENYGYTDLIFATNLKNLGVEPCHIQNLVYHLGLETNRAFIEKTERAMKNVANMIKIQNFPADYLKIISVYQKLNSLCLNSVIVFVFRNIKQRIKKNLLSDNPNLLFFQFYKLGYLCGLLAK